MIGSVEVMSSDHGTSELNSLMIASLILGSSWFRFFTALHALHAGLATKKLSICLSVCQTRDL